MVGIAKVKIKLVREGKINIENKITSPKDAVKIMYEYLDGVDREHLGVMCLNTKHNVLNITTAHIGSLNSSVAHPREIFKSAILSNAAAIIIFHNHPSGDPKPSNEDVKITLRIKECGEILGIELLDSMIIGEDIENGYYSFKEQCYF